MLEYYDVIVVGSGVAGLITSLNLNTNLKVALITKQKLEDCNSYLAQGGISCLLAPTDEDSYVEDTLKAGHYENDAAIVRSMINESPLLIQQLVHYGASFDTMPDGNYHRTREGGHSVNRIYHSGDYTGKMIVSTLIEQVKLRGNITILEDTLMLDLIETDGQVSGIIVKTNNLFIPIYSSKVVLATGGIGGLFPVSTNFPHIRGDGLAIALYKKIPLKQIEYIQIHPTVYYGGIVGRKFLISESVRGEGGILLNKYGKQFTDELKPRDIVTKAILSEMKKTQEEYIYLSLERIPKEKIKNNFPTIYSHCLKDGIDITKEPIKVRPAQHYHMGGIQINHKGMTCIDGLYAIGEVACSGIHGRNRLASNSLLETVYLGNVVAKDINEKKCTYKKAHLDINKDYDRYSNYEDIYAKEIQAEIKRKDEQFYEQWFHA